MSAVELLNNLIAELEISIASREPAASPAATGNAKSKEKKACKASAQPQATQSAPAVKGELNINALDFRVGQIVSVSRHETADKLYCEMIDVGEEQPRAIASGLVPHYTLEEMQNRRLIVVCNLKPRNLVGFKSNGMVLCAAKKIGDTEKVEFVDPPIGAKPGDRISGEGLEGAVLSPSQVEKQKAFETLAATLRVDENGVAVWGPGPGTRLVSPTGEVCCAPTLRECCIR